MLKGFGISLLAHAAALSAACILVVPHTAGRGKAPRMPLVQVVQEMLPEDEEPWEPPEPMPESRPEEPIEVLEDPDPLPDLDYECDPVEIPEESRAMPIGLRLSQSLRPLPPPAPRPITVTVAPRPRPRPRPVGPTCGPVLLNLRQKMPAYPQRARRLGLEGTIVLRIHVDRNGMPKKIEVHRSSGHASLDRAAAESAREWRFRPALKNGVRVEQWYERTIRFGLRS